MNEVIELAGNGGRLFAVKVNRKLNQVNKKLDCLMIYESWALHKKMLQNSEEFHGLPYLLISIVPMTVQPRSII